MIYKVERICTQDLLGRENLYPKYVRRREFVPMICKAERICIQDLLGTEFLFLRSKDLLGGENLYPDLLGEKNW